MSTKLREDATLTPVVHTPEEEAGLSIVRVEEEEDHAWEQKTGLPGNVDPYQELVHQHFRHFCYQEAPGPREALNQLRKLCRKWLQPEMHTKEQLLIILPTELQARVWGYHHRSGDDVVTVLENLETALGDKGQQVQANAHYKQEVLWKAIGPVSLADQSLTVQLKCDPWKHSPLQENAGETRNMAGELAPKQISAERNSLDVSQYTRCGETFQYESKSEQQKVNPTRGKQHKWKKNPEIPLTIQRSRWT
ncbi:zinc finger and SCAN domain-containing protein 23-like isoform X1 [Equus przewalskii]|uniref:Zinc finger and SCAN domain-containing protein 23-like isoform X1 n=1 Tax=Equus przewalskii TaxID=9798 RepID=A0ABM2FMZ8_EQUPR